MFYATVPHEVLLGTLRYPKVFVFQKQCVYSLNLKYIKKFIVKNNLGKAKFHEDHSHRSIQNVSYPQKSKRNPKKLKHDLAGSGGSTPTEIEQECSKPPTSLYQNARNSSTVWFTKNTLLRSYSMWQRSMFVGDNWHSRVVSIKSDQRAANIYLAVPASCLLTRCEYMCALTCVPWQTIEGMQARGM